jgi:GPI-anchor transamidase subunit T
LLIITDNPIPRPVPTEDKAAEPSWSLAEVFGRPLKGACPLTDGSGDGSETVCINVPMEREVQVKTSGTYVEVRHKDGLLRCYKLPSKCIIL